MPHGADTRARSFALALKVALGRIAVACFRHGARTLVLAGLVAVAAAVGASRLTLDPDISELLPPSRESVRNVEALRERFGGIGNVVVLVRGGTPESRRAFADAVVPELERLPTVHYVDARRPVEFFEERALYFLEQLDLETIRDRLNARLRHEIERAQLDLDDEPPPPVDLGDIRDKYEGRLRATAGSSANRNAYYENGDKLAVFAHPTELASNLAFARRVVADVEGALERVPASKFGRDLEVELAGRYKKRVDIERVLVRDLAFTGSLAFLLVLGYVALHFRRLSAIVLLMLPLLLGLELVYGLAGLAFGTLNVLTGFVGAILLGIGIDNGIHMLGRYDESRRKGADPERAVAIALADAGRVSVAAALTTASAFGCLALSDFRAFREFGVLSALGMLLVLGSYVTVLPALLGVFTRHLPSAAFSSPRVIGLPFVPAMMRGAPWIAAALAAAFIALSARAPSVHFNADFAALDRADLPSFRVEPEVNRLLGRSQTPLVVLARDDAQAEGAREVIESRMASLGTRATIDDVVTLSELVPANQSEKQPVIAEIAKTLARFDFERLGPEERRDAERLERMAAAKPFVREDLPEPVLAPFQARDGSGPGHFVLAFPRVSMSDGPAVRELARQLGDLEVGDARLSVAGEPMVMADILETVERDAPRIIALTLLLVAVTLRLTAGSWAAATLAALPAVLTASASAGLLSLLGLELNYLNMVVLPILLGIGVDDGMHVVTRVAEGDPLPTVWRYTGWNIFGAILTDIFGFGALSFAEHPGLASFGRVALVGLGTNLVICVFLLPALLATWQSFVRTRLRPSGG